MKLSDLTDEGHDFFDRPVFRHRDTGVHYCLLDPEDTMDDLIAGGPELYWKGTKEGEPSHPVEFEVD